MEKDLCFKTDRGENLCGVLETPDNTKESIPVVIFCHGFLAEKNKLFSKALFKSLVQNGYAVYRYDLPGHGDSAGDKCEVTLPRNLDDIKGVIDMLEAQLEVDVSRIAVIGHSFGGITALLAPASEPRIKTSISIGSALNFKKIIKHMLTVKKMVERDGYIYYNFIPYFRQQKCHKTLRPYSEEFDFRKEVANVKIPVLLIHGHKDNTIPYKFAQETFTALPGKKELIDLPEEGHLFIRPGTSKKISAIINKWLEENL